MPLDALLAFDVQAVMVAASNVVRNAAVYLWVFVASASVFQSGLEVGGVQAQYLLGLGIGDITG